MSVDRPISGKQYRLTGGSKEKCISNGNTWKESEVKTVSSDAMIEFEESKFDELIDKFIAKYKEEWEAFVYEQYENHVAEWEARQESEV